MIDRFYDESIWDLKYRPKIVDEILTTDKIKTKLKNITEKKDLPNLLFYGPPGCGKTTSAIMFPELLDREVMYINGSIQTGIDTLRVKISKFVSTVSLNGNKKLVIVDECDRLNGNVQDGFKSFIEEFSKAASFVFISNHKNKIIEALQSRLQAVSFKIEGPEQEEILKRYYKRCLEILELEGSSYDKKAVAFVVKTYFPDMRKGLVELQNLSQQGALTDINKVKTISADVSRFFELLGAEKINFSAIRKFTANITDPQGFYSQLNEDCLKYVNPRSVVEFAVLLNKYAYESAFVTDPQINVTAFCCDCISNNVKFKENSSV